MRVQNVNPNGHQQNFGNVVSVKVSPGLEMFKDKFETIQRIAAAMVGTKSKTNTFLEIGKAYNGVGTNLTMSDMGIIYFPVMVSALDKISVSAMQIKGNKPTFIERAKMLLSDVSVDVPVEKIEKGGIEEAAEQVLSILDKQA